MDEQQDDMPRGWTFTRRGLVSALVGLALGACGAPATTESATPAGERAASTRATASLPPRGDGERASPNAHASGVIGGARVDVSFGRPSVRGRTVFGDVVPWDAVWRTGADEATAISFSEDVRVEGQPLAAGVYALFTIPGETSWTVIFNRQAEQWGAYRYDAGQDALRVEVTPIAHETTEQLEIAVADDGLRIRWADVEVPVRIEATR